MKIRAMFFAFGHAASLPAIAWATFKPVRILAPTLNGVTCVDRVCVEEPDRMAEAHALQQAAVSAVGRKLAPLEEAPLTVFCSSRECYRSFAPPDYDLPGYARPLALRYAEWEKRTGRNKVWRAAEDL